jgi:hypothetical protein
MLISHKYKAICKLKVSTYANSRTLAERQVNIVGSLAVIVVGEPFREELFWMGKVLRVVVQS